MSKIQLELGGKYSAGEMFKRAQDDVKAFGRTNKDVIQAGTSTLKELEKGFGQDLSKSINTTKGIIQGLATGGLWGAIGAAAGAAIGFIVDKFKEAKENAKEFANSCGEFVINSLKQIGENFQRTKSDIEAAKAEIQDFAQIAQGSITASANAKLHQLHIETLQKITDTMSQTARKVVEADEALAAAKIKQEEQHWQSIARTEAQEKRIRSANDALAAAKERLEAVETEAVNLTKEENKAILKYAVMQTELEGIIRSYQEGLITEEQATIRSAKKREELTEFLEQHKGIIDGNKAAVEAATKATNDVANAKRALEHEERAMILVEQQNAEAERGAERAIIDATQAKKDAELADKKYAEKIAESTQKEAQREAEKQSAHSKMLQAELEAAEIAEAEAQERKQNSLSALRLCWQLKLDEARFLRIYNQELINGCEYEEALDNAKRLCMEQMKHEAEIIKKCKEAKIEEKDFINRYNDLLSKGFDATEAYARVQKELNDQLKERTNAEKKATKEANDSSTDDPNKPKKELRVSLSTSNMNDIGDKVEEHLSFKDWQKKNREEQRKVRDAKNNMKIDQAKMTKALKGEMPEEEARQWMEYAKKKYTPDQMKELGQLAMNKELLSKKEQQRQAKHIEQMAKEIAKSLTIK